MVVADVGSGIDNSEMKCRPLVGSCLSVLPVGFNADNSKAFIASGIDVIVVNVSTGNWEHVLSHTTVDYNNQSVADFYFSAPDKLITLTETGLRTVWNVNDGTVVSTSYLDVFNNKILRIHADAELGETILCEKNDVLTLFSYKNEEMKEVLKTNSHNAITRIMTAITDDYLVVCEKRMVFVHFFHEDIHKKYEYMGKMKGVKDEETVFVVAAACNDTVAAAMELGRVFIWERISKYNMRVPTRTIHWHRFAPSMVITPFGALLSGGKESTFVKYSLSKTKTALTPSLLPHLQANILSIGLSEDGAIASLLFDDNSVHFVLLASMTVLSSAKALHSRRNGLPDSLLPLISDPLHPDDVVISGYIGRLHWVNVNSGITTETVDITGEKPFSRGVKSSSFDYSDITAASFSKLYGVVSTSRINSEISENLIKFWSRMPVTGYLRLQFECNSGETPVTTVRITENSDAVLSVNAKGYINCWYRKEAGENIWHRSSGVTFQDMIVSYASQFKKSLIALIHKSAEQCVIFGTQKTAEASKQLDDGKDKRVIEGVAVIWDIRSGVAPVVQQCCSLDKFITAEWDPDPSSSLIFLSNASYICSYNIYTESTIWMITDLPGIPRIGVTSDYFYFAVNTEVYLLKECSERLPEPLKFECLQGRHVDKLIGINKSSEFKIVLQDSQGLMLISRKGPTFQLQNNSEVKKSAFARIHNANVPETPKTKIPVETKSAIEVFAGPTHALPSVSILAPVFIEASLLPPKVL